MFAGFSKNTLGFLHGLRENNNKMWFEENRDNYENDLLQPFRELVADLGKHMLAIDPYFEIEPKKCISRIHRDVRFSKDKSPYRANMWLSFKKNTYKDWKEEPVYFFELCHDYYRYGMGFYSITQETLAELRKMIVEDDRSFLKADAAYKKQQLFTMKGEKYKRLLNKNLTEEQNNWHQRKEIYFVCNCPAGERLFKKELVDDIMFGFNTLLPIYDFFHSLRAKIHGGGMR